ncbi:hypothetical protein GW17_00044174, partial [Ensete ventricosum]
KKKKEEEGKRSGSGNGKAIALSKRQQQWRGSIKAAVVKTQRRGDSILRKKRARIH